MENILNQIKYDEKGLVPAIVQDVATKKVLMMAYMNEESLKLTIEKKRTVFFSRSRQELWEKGATSGNVQDVRTIKYDCDSDTLLIMVEQSGSGACHTGKVSCFDGSYILGSEKDECESIVSKIANVIEDRKQNPVEGSYTNYLFEKGIDKMLKKVGEESAEVIIAAKNREKDEVIYEVSDLVFHVLVVLNEQGVKLSDIEKELFKRFK